MTLSETAATQPGSQHPTYDFQMSGRGDVVLADLRRADARLRLPADPGARYLLRGSRFVVAEIAGASKPIARGLPSGAYSVERRSASGRAVGSVVLAHGDDVALPVLAPTRYEVARSKGGPKAGLLYTGLGLSWVDLPGFGPAPAVGIGLRKEVGPVGVRAKIEYAARSVNDAGLLYDFSMLSGTLAALYPLNEGRVLIEAGPAVGYGYATQRLSDKRSFASGVLMGGAAFMVSAPAGPVRIGIDGTIGAHAMKLNGASVVRPAGSTSLLVLYGF
jgi:hypothetical protein